jgi:hypothetical protein
MSTQTVQQPMQQVNQVQQPNQQVNQVNQVQQPMQQVPNIQPPNIQMQQPIQQPMINQPPVIQMQPQQFQNVQLPPLPTNIKFSTEKVEKKGKKEKKPKIKVPAYDPTKLTAEQRFDYLVNLCLYLKDEVKDVKRETRQMMEYFSGSIVDTPESYPKHISPYFYFGQVQRDDVKLRYPLATGPQITQYIKERWTEFKKNEVLHKDFLEYVKKINKYIDETEVPKWCLLNNVESLDDYKYKAMQKKYQNNFVMSPVLDSSKPKKRGRKVGESDLRLSQMMEMMKFMPQQGGQMQQMQQQMQPQQGYLPTYPFNNTQFNSQLYKPTQDVKNAILNMGTKK